jgi:hypothetical protein
VTADPKAFSDTPNNILLIPPYKGFSDPTLFVLTEALIDLVEDEREEMRFTSIIPKLRSNNFLEFYTEQLKMNKRKEKILRKLIRESEDEYVDETSELEPYQKKERDPLHPRKIF